MSSIDLSPYLTAEQIRQHKKLSTELTRSCEATAREGSLDMGMVTSILFGTFCGYMERLKKQNPELAVMVCATAVKTLKGLSES